MDKTLQLRVRLLTWKIAELCANLVTKQGFSFAYAHPPRYDAREIGAKANLSGSLGQDFSLERIESRYILPMAHALANSMVRGMDIRKPILMNPKLPYGIDTYSESYQTYVHEDKVVSIAGGMFPEEDEIVFGLIVWQEE